MPWTEITRAEYRRGGLRYASDMTDAEWGLIPRLLPRAYRRGRPRRSDLRSVVEAVLYILSTGCQWRALPQEFPPYSTVQGYFYAWRDTGRWQRIVQFLSGGREENWGARPGRQPPSSTAKVRQRPRLAGRAAMTPANASTAASAILSPIPMACFSRSMFIPPTFRTAMAPYRCWRGCGCNSLGCAMSLPIASIAGSSFSMRSRTAVHGPSRSSSGPKASKASSFCRDDGLSNEHSPGSADADASPRTSRHPPQLKSHGYSSPISGF